MPKEAKIQNNLLGIIGIALAITGIIAVADSSPALYLLITLGIGAQTWLLFRMVR